MNLLSDTSVFKYTTKMINGDLKEKLVRFIDESTGAVFVTEEQLEDVFYKLRQKTFREEGKYQIIDLFRSGVIKYVYNDKNNITSAIPFFAKKNPDGKFSVILNVTNYGNFDKEGRLNIDPYVFYGASISALFSLVAEKNSAMIASSGLPELYGDLMVVAILKLTNMTSTVREKIKYAFTKFMYYQLLKNEVSASNSAKRCIQYNTDFDIEQLDSQISASSYNNLEDLVNALRELFNEMKGVSFGAIFDKYMRTYGEASGFAIEYIPYFIFQFCMFMTGSLTVVNVKAMESIATKDSSKIRMFYSRLGNVVGTIK